MKQFNLSRLIPVTTAGTMLLGGCGNSVEDNSDSKTREDIKLYLGDICAHMQACDPDGFSDDFDSANECQAYFDDYVSEEYDLGDEDCLRALSGALDCYVNEVDCDEYGYDVCEAEFDGLERVCFNDNPPSPGGSGDPDSLGDDGDTASEAPVPSTGGAVGQ